MYIFGIRPRDPSVTSHETIKTKLLRGQNETNEVKSIFTSNKTTSLQVKVLY